MNDLNRMAANSNAICPRCAQPFICGASSSRCDCFELQLSTALRTRLAEQYDRCLCLACLRQLQEQDAAAPGDPPPA